MLFRAVQCAFCVQQPCKAAGARQLAFQFLLIESFAAKDLDGFCYSGQRVAVFLQLRDTRNFLRNQRLCPQPVGCFVVLCGFSAKPQHDRLMESGKLAACKFPDGKVGKVLCEDFTDVRCQPVVRHDVDEQAAQHECTDALHQKLLFAAYPAAALGQNGQIRRVQEQHMKRLAADLAVKEAAEADAVKPRLRFLRAMFVQLHAVGVAVVAVGKLPKGLAAAAAGVEQICRHALRKRDPAQDVRDIFRVCRIVAHTDMIHQPPDHRRVDGIRLRQRLCKAGQDFIYRLVRSGHEIKASQPCLKLSGFRGQRGFLQFQKIALCIAECPNERIPRFLQFQIVRIRALWLRRAVFLHTGAAFQKALAAAQNGFCCLPKLFQGVKGAFGFLLQFLFHVAVPHAAGWMLSVAKSKTGAFSSGVPGRMRSV